MLFITKIQNYETKKEHNWRKKMAPFWIQLIDRKFDFLSQICLNSTL